MTSPDEKHPIIAGLVALVSVTAAVGVIVALAVVVGSHALGGGGGSGSGTSAAGASMYVPMPAATKTQTGPLVTLSPAPGSSSQSPGSSPSKAKSTKTKSAKPKPKINLTASVVSASSMQLFRLSGTYPGGEGHILRLQRMQHGSGWSTFGIPDMDVQGGQFSCSVQTGYPGANLFRVKDVDTGAVSNAVTVTIG